MNNNNDQLLSVEEAAGFLRLSKHTIRAWISQRKLPFVKLGGRVLFRQDDLNSFINSNLVKPS